MSYNTFIFLPIFMTEDNADLHKIFTINFLLEIYFKLCDFHIDKKTQQQFLYIYKCTKHINLPKQKTYAPQVSPGTSAMQVMPLEQSLSGLYPHQNNSGCCIIQCKGAGDDSFLLQNKSNTSKIWSCTVLHDAHSPLSIFKI